MSSWRPSRRTRPSSRRSPSHSWRTADGTRPIVRTPPRRRRHTTDGTCTCTCTRATPTTAARRRRVAAVSSYRLAAALPCRTAAAPPHRGAAMPPRRCAPSTRHGALLCAHHRPTCAARALACRRRRERDWPSRVRSRNGLSIRREQMHRPVNRRGAARLLHGDGRRVHPRRQVTRLLQQYRHRASNPDALPMCIVATRAIDSAW
jgi:hypothetical protein